MIPNSNIFEQDWWLDISANGTWDKIVFNTKLADIIFTYAMRERVFGIKEIYRPPLTPFLGISLDNKKRELSRSEELKLLADSIPEFVDKMPKVIRFKMNFHPSFDWWSPFFWEGYKQTTKYTYRLDLEEKTDYIWSNFNANTKRNIKRAEKEISITDSNRAEELYDLFYATMINQGKKVGYEKDVLVELCDEIYKRDLGKILIGQDQQGKLHSGVLIVWYNNEAYYLVGGTDPHLRKSGAMMFVMWEAIKMAKNNATVFDFEGSMQKGIDAFIRNFRAIPVPYYQIYKSGLSL